MRYRQGLGLFTYAANSIYGQDNNSNIFNSISLMDGGGGDGNLVHYRAELITLRVDVLSASGGLPGRVTIVWREGARTERFGQHLRRCKHAFDLHGEQLPNPPGDLRPFIVRINQHLERNSV